MAVAMPWIMRMPNSSVGVWTKRYRKGHAGEKNGPNNQPPTPSPAVRKYTNRWFENHAGQGRNRDDKPKKCIGCPQRHCENRQERRLSHLIGGAHDKISACNTDEIKWVLHCHIQVEVYGLSWCIDRDKNFMQSNQPDEKQEADAGEAE